MVAYGDVRKWDAEWLHENVGLLNARCTELVGLSDEVSDAGKTSRWHGEAARAAGGNLASICGGLEDLISEIAAMRTAMGEAADAVTGLLHGVAEAEGLAGRYYLRIEDNGSLTDTASFIFPSEEQRKTWEGDRNRIKAELADRVTVILRRAEDVDNDLSTVIAKCLDVGGVGDQDYDSLTEAARAGGDAGHLSMLEPPQGGTAAANAAWFSTLGEGDKAWILANHPEWIGNLDGIPAEDRHTANMERIKSERAKLEAERDAYLADPKNRYVRQDGYHGIIRRPELDQLEAKLAGIQAILDRVEHPQPGQQQAFLLKIDGGGDGRAIIAMGNPDAATDVATFVPGTGSGLGDVGTSMERADRMANAALLAGSPSASVIAWVDYDAPDTIPDAMGESYADNAKKDLDRFQDGLRYTHDGPASHNSVIGHSYGSTVIGHAGRDERLDANELVFVGSPGVGVRDAAGLNMPTGHVWATAAEHDPVPDTHAHGADPTAPGFHGRVFESAPGTEGPGIAAGYSGEAHSQYWDRDNPSLLNLGRIIAGKPTE